MLVASWLTRTLYSASSASVVAVAVRTSRLAEVAIFCAKRSIVGIPNCASVIFSMTFLKEEKNDLMLLRVSCESSTVSFSSSSVSIFACLSATSDSTQEEVSNPEANPLKEIVISVHLI